MHGIYSLPPTVAASDKINKPHMDTLSSLSSASSGWLVWGSHLWPHEAVEGGVAWPATEDGCLRCDGRQDRIVKINSDFLTLPVFI